MKRFYGRRLVCYQQCALRILALALVLAVNSTAQAQPAPNPAAAKPDTARPAPNPQPDPAQSNSASAAMAGTRPGPATNTAATAGPRIQALYETGNPAQDSVFALDSYLTMEVSGLVPYLRRQEALLRAQGLPPEQAHTKAQDFILYINDAPLVGMGPETVHIVPAVGADTLTKLIFHLVRSPSTYQYWSVVYASPWQFMHPGKIGLGYADRVITNIYPSDGKPVRLKLLRPVALGFAAAAVLLLAFVILRLGWRSRMLRDSLPGVEVPKGHELEFSLAKCQLAWWTFLVLGGYLLIYCVTGEQPNISNTTLALLGISAGTAGASSLLSKMPATTAVDGALGQPVPVVPYTSRGWWTDIVSDDKGVSMHRLQQVGFTLLLGYLFVRSIYKTVALPEWNDNETLLMVISSATYLGLKAQEGVAGTTPAADTAAAGSGDEAAGNPASSRGTDEVPPREVNDQGNSEPDSSANPAPSAA